MSINRWYKTKNMTYCFFNTLEDDFSGINLDENEIVLLMGTRKYNDLRNWNKLLTKFGIVYLFYNSKTNDLRTASFYLEPLNDV